MLIGELVKKSGLTKETIRHYEELGLLRGVKVQANGYKNYPESTVEDMFLLSVAKG
jgi:MerR family copper efflux transcriptional regulator